MHSATGEVLFRGTGAVTTSKSLLLLSVSVQPLVLRTAPCVLTKAVPLFTVVLPSPLLEAPYETKSMIPVAGKPHGVAVAPHPSPVAPFTKATFPEPALNDKLVVVKSAVTGKSAPAVPTVPHCTSK